MKLSLVIPAYNEESEIAACLNAVAAQTVMPDEVIIVDNNCSDKTMEIAAGYPFATLIHEPRQGIVFARNAGFNVATGDIIGRIDVDIQLPPDWTAKVKAVMADDSIGAVTGPVYFKDMPAKDTLEFLDKKLRGFAFRHGSSHAFLFGSNMAIRKRAWNKVKDKVCTMQKFHEDTDLGIHVSMAGEKIIFAEDIVTGMSGRVVDQTWLSSLRYVDQALEAYRYHGLNTVMLAILYYWVAVVFQPGLRLIRAAYDPKSQSISLKKLLASLPAKARKLDEKHGSQYNGGKL